MDFDAFDYDPLIVVFFEGLQETKYPYNFICLEGIKKLCS